MFCIVIVIFFVMLLFVLVLYDVGVSQYVKVVVELSVYVGIIGQIFVLIGWYIFCQEYEVECYVVIGGVQWVFFNEQSWKVFFDIDYLVNQNIGGILDEDYYQIYVKGIVNWWIYFDDGMGNCNDYVIFKKWFLVEVGWLSLVFFFIVVFDYYNEGYLVFMVCIDCGDFIFDNFEDKVFLWYQMGYMFLKW